MWKTCFEGVCGLHCVAHQVDHGVHNVVLSRVPVTQHILPGRNRHTYVLPGRNRHTETHFTHTLHVYYIHMHITATKTPSLQWALKLYVHVWETRCTYIHVGWHVKYTCTLCVSVSPRSIYVYMYMYMYSAESSTCSKFLANRVLPV